MMFIEIFVEYQKYRSYEIFLGFQSFSCFQSDYCGSELASKQFALVADNCGGRIVHYKWNSICIPWNVIVIRANGYGKSLIYRVGIGLCPFWRRLPFWTLLFLEYIYAARRLNQILMRPQKIGYNYAKIISVNESTDLSRPSGGSGKRFKINMYRISRCNGSS